MLEVYGLRVKLTQSVNALEECHCVNKDWSIHVTNLESGIEFFKNVRT